MKQKTSVEKVEKDLFLVLKVKNCTKEILAQNRRNFELDNSFAELASKLGLIRRKKSFCWVQKPKKTTAILGASGVPKYFWGKGVLVF